jgi:hypothetical protein
MPNGASTTPETAYLARQKFYLKKVRLLNGIPEINANPWLNGSGPNFWTKPGPNDD